MSWPLPQAGAHSLALKSNGTVVAWGHNNYGQSTVPGGLSSVVAISAGVYHSLALKSNGTLVAWGDNHYGQSWVPPGLSGVVAIAAGQDHNLVLRSDGTVLAWGRNDYGQSFVPFGLSNVAAIAGGGSHSLALKSDGTVVAWGAGGPGQSGDPHYGQSTVPSGLSNVVAIAAGEEHSLALRSDGTVVAWGSNTYIVPGGLSNVVAISAGGSLSMALVALPVESPTLQAALTGTNLILFLAGEPGKTALIQASTDLKHWRTLGSCVLSDQPVPFTDPQSALFPRRFYRLVLPYGAPWLEESRWAGGQMTFNPVGMPGGTVVVEASTNLATWAPIATNVLGNTPTPFTDPQSAQFSQRFYRLLKP